MSSSRDSSNLPSSSTSTLSSSSKAKLKNISSFKSLSEPSGYGSHKCLKGNESLSLDSGESEEELLLKTSHKSVCFHSMLSTEHGERKIASPLDCLQFMINGTMLIKVKANTRQYRRFFSLTEDLSEIRWVPSSKKSSKAKYCIKDIKEVRPGKSIDVAKSKENSGIYPEDTAFSIIYGDEYESFDFVASSLDESNIWITGLNFLIRANKCSGQKMREKWLLEVFDEADSDGKGLLQEWETIALMKKLNSQLCIRSLKQKIMEYNFGKGGEERSMINKNLFVTLFNETATRPDIYFILFRYCGKDFISVEDLQLFLEGEQGLLGISLKDCEALINRFESSEEAKNNKQLLIDGFTQLLMSKESDVFNSSKEAICQDMKQPLAHYFISTYHNTHVYEEQLKGQPLTERYSKALLQGARCVQIDCWNSPKGPVVFDGSKLAGKVLLQDVLEIINECAFIITDYPLIIHLENHCNVELQKKISQMLINIFKENLFIPNQQNSLSCDQSKGSFLNSLHDLRKKILIMGKKLPDTCDEGEISEEDDLMDVNKRSTKRILLCKELSNLFALTRTSCSNFSSFHHNLMYNEVCCLSENLASKMAKNSTLDFINHNKSVLTKTVPDTRLTDSNSLNPLDYWICGCQFVPINDEAHGSMIDIYQAWFRKNGSCGYILKPSFLRDHKFYFNSHHKEPLPGIEPLTIRIKIISGQQLPMPKGASSKAVSIDPYVTVQIIGVAVDCAERRTRTVSNNNPQFDEVFEFNVTIPELALIRFKVLDDEYIHDDFIGQCTVRLDCIQRGYRHVQLFAQNGELIENASLLVHISLTYRAAFKNRLRRKKSWNSKQLVELKSTGLKQIDDFFKSFLDLMNQSFQLKRDFDKSLIDLCDECNFRENANLAQCLRVLILRLASCLTITSFDIIENEQEYLSIKVIGEMGTKLTKSIATLEKTLFDFKFVSQNALNLINTMTQFYESILDTTSKLPVLSSSIGHLVDRKMDKIIENLNWNLSYIRIEIDSLKFIAKEAECALKQVVRIKDALQKLFLKERETFTSCKSEVAEVFQHSTLEVKPIPILPSSPNDGRLRGILKKSAPNNIVTLANQYSQDKTGLTIFHQMI